MLTPSRDATSPNGDLHIAIDARTINSSTGTVIVNLLRHLQELDRTNRYTVLLSTKDRTYWQPSQPNFSVSYVDAPPYSVAEQTTLRRALKALSPDLIHFCMPQQPLFFYRGRKITSIHDLITLRIRNPHLSTPAFVAKNAIGWFAFRRGARESAGVIACSHWTRQDVIDTLGVRPDRVRMIYDAGDVHRGARVAYEHPFDRYLLYVGSQFAYKNVKRLCDAHQRLLDTHPRLGLILVGRPDRESEFTRAYVAEKGYRNIVFTGFIPDAQRDWLYENTAAYIFPSLMEGFGLPGLEAMGYGAPVVSSDRTCLPEVYGDGALYFDPENVDDIVLQIGRVLDDDALRRELIARGAERFGVYSWRRMAEQVLQFYLDVGSKLPRRATDARFTQ